MTADARRPVAVGGIGGSGTRVLAAFLHDLGYFLGDDLNEALDNLWFTLLFKRRSILLENEAEFRELAALFVSRMSGQAVVSEADRVRLSVLTATERLQHPRQWLIERARSFIGGNTSKRPGQPWCWKEPNSHVVIERLFACQPDLCYIHLVRHPLDMAVSPNQNQLQNWGSVFLDRDIAITPCNALSFWCAAHRRIARLARSWPERTLIVDFDAFCLAPESHCAAISNLLGVDLPGDVLADVRQFVRAPASAGRFRSSDLSQYQAADLAYVAEIGYRF